MKLNKLAAVAAVLGASMAVSLNAGPNVSSDFAIAPDFFPKRKRGKGQNNRRGKGKCNPPKSRPNRLTISKRVCRKHRRAR